MYNMTASSSAWDRTYYAQYGDVVVEPYSVYDGGVALDPMHVE